MLYSVDYGDKHKIKTLAEIEELYAIRIDKWDYPDFNTWLTDMKKMGLIVEVV